MSYSTPSGRAQVGQSPSGPAFTMRCRCSLSSWYWSSSALPLGLGVLRVAHPGGAQRLAVERDGGERGAQVAHPLARAPRAWPAPGPAPGAPRPRPGGGGRRRAAPGRPLRAPRTTRPAARARRPRRGARAAAPARRHTSSSCRARGRGFGHLALEPLGPLGGGGHLVVGHAQLGLEGQRSLAELLQLLPARADLGQASLAAAAAAAAARLGRRGPPPRARGRGPRPPRARPDPTARRGARRAGRASADRRSLSRSCAARIRSYPSTRERNWARSGRAHRRHDRELLLAGEVGVEELVAGHAQEAGDPLGDGADAVGDRRRIAVLVELGAVERAKDAVLVGAEREVELDLHPGARRRPAAANGLPAAARGRHAVHRPGDGLEQGGLARAVGADDAGEAGAELELGVLVLAEVAAGGGD